MSLARFQDVCADAADATRIAGFWGAVLGQPVVTGSDGSPRLDPGPGQPSSRRVWVDQVPEAPVGTRVHLALRLPDPDLRPLLDLGAVLVREPTGDEAWSVLADPDGSTFRAVGPSIGVPPPAAREPFELVVDSLDPSAQAHWWAGVLGGEVGHDEDRDVAWISGAAGFPHRYWVFASTAQPKVAKNRWHWDVTMAADEPSGLLAAGAMMLRERGGDIDWWILADPEGNEFCAFAPAQAGAAAGASVGFGA